MRRARRAARVAVFTTLMLGAVAAPAPAATQRELVGDATAQSFTLRADADQGGSTPLPFFFGSYADAYLTTPPSEADGQASWYNFGIAETALFKPPEECTPEQNTERVREGLEFVADWFVGQVTSVAGDPAGTAQSLLDRNIPAAPAPTLPCGGGRFPGFAQSRYPATSSIGPAASDDLLVSGACGDNEACAGALGTATAGVVDGGSFHATATSAPSQSSDALVAGVSLGPLLRISVARSIASTALEGQGRIVSTAGWTVSGLCFLPAGDGCTLRIDQIRKTARLVRSSDGKVLERDARTVITGVHGSGAGEGVEVGDLAPGAPPVELGNPPGCDGCLVLLQAVSLTGGCGDPASDGVADTGGFRLFARGNGSVVLPIPLIGTAVGGGLMLGGACAGGRLGTADIGGPPILGGGGGGNGSTGVVPPVAGVPGIPPTVTGPLLSPPRVVARQDVRYVFRSAPAWRTLPYWGSILGVLLLLAVLGYLFRRSPVVAPAARTFDRFARQFVRG